jgi:hypothetical protein
MVAREAMKLAQDGVGRRGSDLTSAYASYINSGRISNQHSPGKLW